KSLVLLTSGFPLTPERQSELSAVIDACNKANVAVYPIDVRGLVAPLPGRSPGAQSVSPATRAPAHLMNATFSASSMPHLIFVQHGGAGGGGGRPGGGGAGGGGGHGGGGGGTGGGGHGGGGHGGGTGGGGHGGTGGTGGHGGN